MKRLTGASLNDVLLARYHHGDCAGWTRRELLTRLVDVCLAIQLAHDRGVIHRDLKPANIVLGSYGEVYVIDWGIARVLDEHDDDAITPGPGARDARLRGAGASARRARGRAHRRLHAGHLVVRDPDAAATEPDRPQRLGWARAIANALTRYLDGAGLHVHPWAVARSPVQLVLVMIGVTLGQLVATATMVIRLRGAKARAEAMLQVQLWHLRQLLPAASNVRAF
jgi:serine/threonine protein kinase